MRFYTSVVIVALLIMPGCADNPLEFSKITPVPTIKPESAPVTVVPEQQQEKTYTLLELYLIKAIEREYIMAWFFEDTKQYRAKLFYIKSEIEAKMPLTPEDRDRILALQVGLNEAIEAFNNKNVFIRTRKILGAAIEEYKQEYVFPGRREVKRRYTLEEIKEHGLDPSAISNNFYGFLASLSKYGFRIEPVNLLD